MSEPVTVSPIKYFAVFAALQVLLAATYFLSRLNLGSFGVSLALLIAGIKAVLVMLYFMHLKNERGDTGHLYRVVAGIGIFWLGILITLTLSDYLTRDWLRLPGVWPVPGQ